MQVRSLVYSLAIVSLICSTGVFFSEGLEALPVLAQTTSNEDRQAEGDRLLEQSDQQLGLGQYQNAIQSLQQALERYREVGDRLGEVRALKSLGRTYSEAGQSQQALPILEQALALSHDLDGDNETFLILMALSKLFAELGQHEQNLEVLQQAQNILDDTEANSPEEQRILRIYNSSILMGKGFAYMQMGQLQQAEEFWQRARSTNQEVGNRDGEARVIGLLASLYRSTGRVQQAIELNQLALGIFRELGDSASEAETLRSLSSAYGSSLGDYDQSLDLLQQALLIVQRIGDRGNEAVILGDMGEMENRLGNYQRSVERYQESLAVAQEIGYSQYEALALSGLSGAYSGLGKYAQAIEVSQKLLELGQGTANLLIQSNALTSLARVYGSYLGNHARSLDYYQQALKLARDSRSLDLESQALLGLGDTYLALGRPQQAIENQQLALDINRELGHRPTEILILWTLADSQLSLGRSDQALTSLKQALTVAQETGDREAEAATLIHLGYFYSRLQQAQAALQTFKQAQEIYQEINNQSNEPVVFNALSSVYLSLGQYPQALAFAQQGATLAQKTGDRLKEAGNLFLLGETYRRLGNLPEAERFLFTALDTLESFRLGLEEDSDRRAIFNQQVAFYPALQRVLIDQNKGEQALQLAERGRVRALVELLSDRLSMPDTSTQFSEVPNITPPSLEEIKQTAKQQNATLVTYSVTNFAVDPMLYIWVVHPTGRIDLKQVPLDSLNQLRESVVLSLDTIEVRGREQGATIVSTPSAAALEKQRLSLQKLHQLLIEPIAQYLPKTDTDRIIFIPHGELFSVPFPALMDANGRYLVEKHTISTAPSIQFLALTSQKRQQQRSRYSERIALVVGNPTMPQVWEPSRGSEIQLSPLVGSEQEAKAIADLFNTQPLLQSQATESVVAERMPQARIIHLATHGLLEYGDPQQFGIRDLPGAIALAPSDKDDGLLTSAEILSMNLQAELVVLSACDTGRGQITGDGVIGLSRSFVAAGVPSVIVSLWAVPDDSTLVLMQEFYRLWQDPDQPLDKAQALRQAMLNTMKEHPNPRDWAAFTLIGEAG